MDEKKFTKQLSFKRMVLPVILGLATATWMLLSSLNTVKFVEDVSGEYVWVDANQNDFVDTDEPTEFQINTNKSPEIKRYRKTTNAALIQAIQITWTTIIWLIISLLAVVMRDLGYMIRIRILTKNQLSWKQAFDTIMLWEFASAITPSVVGGSGVAIYILNREGLSVGKSTAVVMVTAMLDELFYIMMVPLVMLVIGTEYLFPVNLQKEILGMTLSTKGIFWAGYFFIVSLTILITLSIFLYPRLFKFWMLKIFKFRLLSRWRYKIIQVGDDLVTTSNELKGEKFSYWFKAFITTILSWTSRYFVVNFLILSFGPLQDHMLVYGRQLVMWVIMLISPTPGSAGVAELAFTGFLKEFTAPGTDSLLAILWRLLSYYPYLFIGAILLPTWLRRTAGFKKSEANV